MQTVIRADQTPVQDALQRDEIPVGLPRELCPQAIGPGLYIGSLCGHELLVNGAQRFDASIDGFR